VGNVVASMGVRGRKIQAPAMMSSGDRLSGVPLPPRPTIRERIAFIASALDDLQKISEVLSERLAPVMSPPGDNMLAAGGETSKEPMSDVEINLDAILSAVRFRDAFLQRILNSLRV